MNDSQQNLIEVRRSSGEKEWMTKEQLEALNKQRALKREKLNKPASRFKLLSQATRQRHQDTEKSFKAALIPL